MGTILSALFKGVFEAIMGGLCSLLTSWAIFRRGEKSQQADDLREAVSYAEEANKISSELGTLSDDELNQRVHDEQDRRRRMFLGKTD